MEVRAVVGEWCFREKSRIVCREIVARWRIPDCERALLANGQKNRCEVAHALGSVKGMSEHFLTVRHSYPHSSLLQPTSLFLSLSSFMRFLQRIEDKDEIHAKITKLHQIKIHAYFLFSCGKISVCRDRRVNLARAR